MDLIKFPPNVWKEINTNLSFNDILNLRLTSNALNNLMNHSEFTDNVTICWRRSHNLSIKSLLNSNVIYKHFRFDNFCDSFVSQEIFRILIKFGAKIESLKLKNFTLTLTVLLDLLQVSRDVEILELCNVRYKTHKLDNLNFVKFGRLKKLVWIESDPKLLQHILAQFDVVILNSKFYSNLFYEFLADQIFLEHLKVEGAVTKLFTLDLHVAWDVSLTSLSICMDTEIDSDNINLFLRTQNFLENLELQNLTIDKELWKTILYELKNLRSLSLENLKCTDLYDRFLGDFKEKNSKLEAFTFTNVNLNYQFCSKLFQLTQNVQNLVFKEISFSADLISALKFLDFKKICLENCTGSTIYNYNFPNLEYLEFRGDFDYFTRNFVRSNPQVEVFVVPKNCYQSFKSEFGGKSQIQIYRSSEKKEVFNFSD